MPHLRYTRTKTIWFLSLALVILLLVAFAWERSSTQNRSSSPPITTITQEVPWIEVYFTAPYAPQAENLRGGPDAALVKAIEGARLSIDLAMYDLDLWSVRDALLNAHRRGLSIRMVTESDHLEQPEIQDLKENGISVLGDRREGLMHNKFIVIDRQEVWTGSMNLTVSDVYRNDNNWLCIRSTQLAENYLTEFEEMFEEDQFGPGSPANTPYPTLSVKGTTLRVYFSPEDGVAQHLIELIEGAKESIYFLAFSFTADDLATTLLERASQGIVIKGVFEKSQYASNVGSEYERLRAAGLDVRLDGNPQQMHHKVMIFDKEVVVTGSYNFSASAEESNDENVLILYSQPIAAQFLMEFQRVYDMGEH